MVAAVENWVNPLRVDRVADRRVEIDHAIRRASVADPGVDGLALGVGVWIETFGAARRRHRAEQHPQTPGAYAGDQRSVAAQQLLDRRGGRRGQIIDALEDNNRRDAGLTQHVGVEPPDCCGPEY